MVHPSLEESFGMTVLEAMAVGTPVIAAAQSGGPPWLLDNGDAGILADVSNARELASATLNLLQDAGLRARLSASAWHRARVCFSESAVVAQVEEVAETCVRTFVGSKP